MLVSYLLPYFLYYLLPIEFPFWRADDNNNKSVIHVKSQFLFHLNSETVMIMNKN